MILRRVSSPSTAVAGRSLSRFDAVPPTATISAGVASGASATSARTAARMASISARVGGSDFARSRVILALPTRSPIARAAWPGPMNTSSELPPPMSTTSSSDVTGRPPVTPRSISSASSSCASTWNGTPARCCTSWTSVAESAARRIGSVPTIVISVAPSPRAASAYPARVVASSSRAASPM